MNLLCPSCQKTLQVAEENAGQQMKCPHCSTMFTAPSLAVSPAPPPSSPLTVTPPAFAPYESVEATPPPVLQPDHEIYSFVPSEAAPVDRKPEAAPPPVRPRPEVPPRAASEPPVSPRPTATAPAPPPAGYLRTATISLSPRVVPWITPAALGIVFFLMFFTWVGWYPADIPVFTQNGWQVAFGSYGFEKVFWSKVMEDNNPESPDRSWLGIFFVLTFLPALLLAVGVIAVPRLNVHVPPVVERLWPWRTAIVGGASLLTLFFLVLLLLGGFPLEKKLQESAKQLYGKHRADAKTDEGNQVVDLKEGMHIGQFQPRRTVWLDLVLIFLLMGVLGVVLDFWLERRGKARPMPRVDIHW